MSAKLQGILSVVLVGIYSWIMMATGGAAGWAWLILAAAAVLIFTARRSLAGEGAHR
jgi:hypothetical protein